MTRKIMIELSDNDENNSYEDLKKLFETQDKHYLVSIVDTWASGNPKTVQIKCADIPKLHVARVKQKYDITVGEFRKRSIEIGEDLALKELGISRATYYRRLREVRNYCRIHKKEVNKTSLFLHNEILG